MQLLFRQKRLHGGMTGKRRVKRAEKECMEHEFQTGDRVKRINTDGPFGTVQSVRVETVRQSIKIDENEPLSVTVTVLWDNGSLSHLIPEGLSKTGDTQG